MMLGFGPNKSEIYFLFFILLIVLGKAY